MMIGDEHGWLELKKNHVQQPRDVHEDTEEEGDGNRVDEVATTVGEGEGGLGRRSGSRRDRV